MGFKFFRGIDTITLNLTSLPVVGEVRRLRATWTPEIVQDLESFHNINAEAELSAILSEQINREINNEVINRIIENTNNINYLNQWMNLGNRA